MSKYTTEVRYICENYAGLTESTDYTDINTVVDTAAPIIFESFPIFDENYRAVLERKILRHYYTREICAETVGLWKLWLNNKMNEIMPFYNKLYESELIKFNPMYDVDISTIKSGNENTNKTENENATGNKVSNDSESLTKNAEETNERNIHTNESENNINNTNEETNTSNLKNESKNKNKNETGKENNTDSENSVSNIDKYYNESGNKSSTTHENSVGNENDIENTNSTSTNRNAFSDTPQGNLTSVDNGNYLSDYRKIDEVNEEKNNSSKNTNTDFNGTASENSSGNSTETTENSEVKNNINNKNFNNDSNENENNITNEKSNGSNNVNSSENKNRIENESSKNKTENETNENRNRISNNRDSSNINRESNIGTTEQYIEKVSGKRGGISYSKMLQEFRKTFLNIDSLIINELADLFMNIY